MGGHVPQAAMKAIHGAVAAVKEAGATPWRSIESAPLDGTLLDLWGATPLSGTTYEFRGETHTRASGARRTDIVWDIWHKCWRVACDPHYVHRLDPFVPTHWMVPVAGPSVRL